MPATPCHTFPCLSDPILIAIVIHAVLGQVTAPLLHALLQTTAANLTDTAFLCTAYPDLSLAVEVRLLF